MNVTNLAKDVGISRGQMNNILTQKSATTIETLVKLAVAFETDPSSLLSMRNVDVGMLKAHSERDSAEIMRLRGALAAALSSSGTQPKSDNDYQSYREDVEKLAQDLIADAFYQIDDEGKLALLRIAVSIIGWSPELEGVKMPRDWRDLVYHVANDWGWLELQDEDTRQALENAFEQQR